MRIFTKNSNPDDFEDYMELCRKAYNMISERWEDFDDNMSAIDANLAYARSPQMWQDCEEGERLLILEDFQLAKEFKDYMDISDRAIEDRAWFSVYDREVCNYAGCHG